MHSMTLLTFVSLAYLRVEQVAASLTRRKQACETAVDLSLLVFHQLQTLDVVGEVSAVAETEVAAGTVVGKKVWSLVDIGFAAVAVQVGTVADTLGFARNCCDTDLVRKTTYLILCSVLSSVCT